MIRKVELLILIGCKGWGVKCVLLLGGLDGGGCFYYVLKV